MTLPAHIETVADLRAWLSSEDAELGAALQGRGIHVVVDQVISNRDTESVRRADEIAFMPPLERRLDERDDPLFALAIAAAAALYSSVGHGGFRLYRSDGACGSCAGGSAPGGAGAQHFVAGLAPGALFALAALIGSVLAIRSRGHSRSRFLAGRIDAGTCLSSPAGGSARRRLFAIFSGPRSTQSNQSKRRRFWSPCRPAGLGGGGLTGIGGGVYLSPLLVFAGWRILSAQPESLRASSSSTPSLALLAAPPVCDTAFLPALVHGGSADRRL